MSFEKRELNHLVSAIIILTAVAGFSFILLSNWNALAWTFVFATMIIAISVFSKKITAYLLDADVEHQLWTIENYGWKSYQHFQSPIPASIIFPLAFTLFTLGKFKLTTLLTYETRALKVRAARRFGFYSYTEMTEWHNGLIGAIGVISLLILSSISYIYGAEYLAKLAAYYAFFSMIPISNLDGTQIFFGSRILWTCLAVIVTIFAAYALIL